jgi:hypothetical protein
MKLRKGLLRVSIFYEDPLYSGVQTSEECVYLWESKLNTNFYVCRHTFEPPSKQPMTAYDATPSHLISRI